MQSLPSTSTSSNIIDGKVPCSVCGDKMFKTLKSLKQHKAKYHKITEVVAKKQFIVCPLCEERTEFKTNEDHKQHIENTHDVSIEVITLQFFSLKELETWTKSEKVETMYAKHRSNQMKDYKVVDYHCNKSDIRGYVPKYQKYTEKAGGTIRMKGVCPSRIKCILYSDGKATVTYWKTHVGHDVKELRSKHLSSVEKDMVIEKLKSGVPCSKILEDARKMDKPELERINLLSSKDVAYLHRKHNIEKKRELRKKKHVHLVRMYEEHMDTNSVADDFEKTLEESSTIKTQKEMEVCQFIEEERNCEVTLNQDGTATDRDKMNAQLKYYFDWAEDLQDEDLAVCINQLQLAKKKIDEKRHEPTKKRKIEKQEYFPSNKHSKVTEI